MLLTAIANCEGKRVPDYIEYTGLSSGSIERYMKQLRKIDLIEYKGEATQTGGYYLTKKMKTKNKPLERFLYHFADVAKMIWQMHSYNYIDFIKN